MKKELATAKERIENFEQEIVTLKQEHEVELKRLQQDLEAKHKQEMDEMRSKHQEETRAMQKQMDDQQAEVGAFAAVLVSWSCQKSTRKRTPQPLQHCIS